VAKNSYVFKYSAFTTSNHKALESSRISTKIRRLHWTD